MQVSNNIIPGEKKKKKHEFILACEASCELCIQYVHLTPRHGHTSTLLSLVSSSSLLWLFYRTHRVNSVIVPCLLPPLSLSLQWYPASVALFPPFSLHCLPTNFLPPVHFFLPHVRVKEGARGSFFYHLCTLTYCLLAVVCYVTSKTGGIY